MFNSALWSTRMEISGACLALQTPTLIMWSVYFRRQIATGNSWIFSGIILRATKQITWSILIMRSTSNTRWAVVQATGRAFIWLEQQLGSPRVLLTYRRVRSRTMAGTRLHPQRPVRIVGLKGFSIRSRTSFLSMRRSSIRISRWPTQAIWDLRVGGCWLARFRLQILLFVTFKLCWN